MTYQDKSIQCSDCGATFTFGAQKQEDFASRGYTSEPKRCPSCRETRKAQRNSDGGSSYRSNSYSNTAPRQMYPAKCATCGKDCQVPFEPRSGRPVYCSDCYNKIKPAR
jgi:CxxC-x17-CxxC domain-containing protein